LQKKQYNALQFVSASWKQLNSILPGVAGEYKALRRSVINILRATAR
jgi:hypothetical protein